MPTPLKERPIVSSRSIARLLRGHTLATDMNHERFVCAKAARLSDSVRSNGQVLCEAVFVSSSVDQVLRIDGDAFLGVLELRGRHGHLHDISGA